MQTGLLIYFLVFFQENKELNGCFIFKSIKNNAFLSSIKRLKYAQKSKIKIQKSALFTL